MTLGAAMSQAEPLEAVLRDLRACRICRDAPLYPPPLPHEPRPVIQASATARLCIAGQAPGTRVHASGRPFTDPSGVRLRSWLGLDEAAFYDEARVAIVPMGHCFPGLDAKGGDRPPRRECAPHWRSLVLAALPEIELVLAIGRYAQAWHLGPSAGATLSQTMASWRAILERPVMPRVLPLPHPSWRNNAWLTRNPWFEAELVPVLRAEIARLVSKDVPMSPSAQR
jgi:uracil-DNA glycosylase